MKMRFGFVTNSSSSSFILNFKSKHTIHEELTKEKGLSAEQIAWLEEVLQREGKRLSVTSFTGMVKDELLQQYRIDQYLYRSRHHLTADWDDPLSRQYQDKYDHALEKMLAAVKDGDHIVQIEVGDETSMGAAMEWDILPYLGMTVSCFRHH